MKVYMLKDLEEDDYWGCYSTKEKAQAEMDMFSACTDLAIEEYEVQ